jgi:c-di-GMP phosphodiesterase
MQTTEARAVRPAAPSYAQIIRLMNRVRGEAPMDEVEDDLKADPVIAFRLMTHINSAGMGFPRHINNFRQAVTILGYHGVYRWLAMLLVTADQSDGRSGLARNAIVRGRFLELIGKVQFDGARAADLFVVGTFSLLDGLFGETMQKLVGELSIAYEMRQALLSRDGPYGPLLELAEAIERADEAHIDRFQAQLEISTGIIYDTYTQALEWADQVLA